MEDKAVLEALMFAVGMGAYKPYGPGVGHSPAPVPDPFDWSVVAATLLGLWVSMLAGGGLVAVILERGKQGIRQWAETDVLTTWVDRRLILADLERHQGSVPGLYMGLLERGFFTLAVVVDPPTAITAMPVWLLAKLAANWQIRGSDRYTRSRAMLAVAVGLLAMLFSLVGGLICRWGGLRLI